jgi:hypothetical protein
MVNKELVRGRAFTHEAQGGLDGFRFVSNVLLKDSTNGISVKRDDYAGASVGSSTTTNRQSMSMPIKFEEVHKEVKPHGTAGQIKVSQKIFKEISDIVSEGGDRGFANPLVNALLASCGSSPEEMRLKEFLNGVQLDSVTQDDDGYVISLKRSMEREKALVDLLGFIVTCYALLSWGAYFYTLFAMLRLFTTMQMVGGLLVFPSILIVGCCLLDDHVMQRNGDKFVEITLSEQVFKDISDLSDRMREVADDGIYYDTVRQAHGFMQNISGLAEVTQSTVKNQNTNGLESWEFDREIVVKSTAISTSSNSRVAGVEKLYRDLISTTETMGLRVYAQEVKQEQSQIEMPISTFNSLEKAGQESDSKVVAQQLLSQLAASAQGPEARFIDKWLSGSCVTDVVKGGDNVQIKLGCKSTITSACSQLLSMLRGEKNKALSITLSEQVQDSVSATSRPSAPSIGSPGT